MIGKEDITISIFRNLFGKRTGGTLPTAYVYVDFEHWYISMDKLHSQKPDIKSWHEELMEKYNIRNIVFFADFSNPKLKSEISDIRQVTNSVIDTQNTGHYKKDYTDFIMLDYIYQNAIDNAGIDTHIIFTGDGHFSSVIKFLTNKLRKNVVLYGVKGAFSSQLKAAVKECHELPQDDEKKKYYRMIAKNFEEIANTTDRRIIPTFMSTVETLSAQYEVPVDTLKQELAKMIDEGYLYKREKRVGRKRVKILEPNMEKMKADRLLQS